MNHGTERNRKRWEAMTPKQRAAVESIRARHSTPESREKEERDRVAIKADFPPREVADGKLVSVLFNRTIK